MSNNISIDALITALRRFNQFDHKMQVSTILTFLECAKAERNRKDISVQDIEKLVGLRSGTASRNVYYWADGHKDMTGGHNLITVTMNSEDRRRRDLRLTAKGKAFLGQLLGE
jgi:DNA-binding MarR family transcriptional regulator